MEYLDVQRRNEYSDTFSVLTVQVNGPAFQIDPKESIVTLESKPTSFEFLITPSKSGKHLLAVDFRDKSGQIGYLRTTIQSFFSYTFLEVARELERL